MNIKEIAGLVGKPGTFSEDGMHWEIKINDARQTWGRLQLFISPIAGTGNRWVYAEKVEVHTDDKL